MPAADVRDDAEVLGPTSRGTTDLPVPPHVFRRLRHRDGRPVPTTGLTSLRPGCHCVLDSVAGSLKVYILSRCHGLSRAVAIRLSVRTIDCAVLFLYFSQIVGIGAKFGCLQKTNYKCVHRERLSYCAEHF